MPSDTPTDEDTVWNSTRMYIWTHLKAESEGKTGLGVYVGNGLQSFRKFTPRQKLGSINLDLVMEAISKDASDE